MAQKRIDDELDKTLLRQLQAQQGLAGQPVDVPQPVTDIQGQPVPVDADTPDWLLTNAQLQERYGGNVPGASGNAVISPGVAQTAAPAQTGYQQRQSGAGLPEIPQTGWYNPDANEAYQQAMTALQQAMGQRPSYTDTWSGTVQNLMGQIMNREPFQYDFSRDPLYRQYREQAMETGRLAMQDTMGRAAGLTGGYGSTYAQSLGSQAYDAYLRSLNEQIPALQQAARSAYDAEGDRLAQLYSMAATQQDREYSMYRNQMDDYWRDISMQSDLADRAYDRGRQIWQDQYNAAWDQYNAEMAQDQLLYGRDADSYDRLMQLITNTGYQPSAEELAAAGMSQGQADAWGDYYRIQQDLARAKSAGSYSSGGSRSSGTGSDSGSGFIDEEGNAVSPKMAAYLSGNVDYGDAVAYLMGNGYGITAAKTILGSEDAWNEFVAAQQSGSRRSTTSQTTTPRQTTTLGWATVGSNTLPVRRDVINNATEILGQISNDEAKYQRMLGMYKSGTINDAELVWIAQNILGLEEEEVQQKFNFPVR